MPPCRRVKVTSIAVDSTEDSLRDFFSFCGDIKLIHLYPGLGGEGQEAVILFESESGASTAVLLDNAVVDGARIRVEPFPENIGGSGRASPAQTQRSPTNNITSSSPHTIPPNSVSCLCVIMRCRYWMK